MTHVSFQRVARSAAAGAFIFALSLTSLGSSAVASSAADKHGEKGCSALAHVRNEAVSDLRDAWRGFRKEVREMAHDARDLRKESSDRAAFTALMTELRDANGQLDSIRKGAREQMQTLFSATVCNEQAEKAEKDNDENEATELSPDVSALATQLAAQLDTVVKTAVSEMKAVTVALKATVASALEAAKAAEKAKAKDNEDKDEDKDENHDKNHERKGHDENEATEDRNEHAKERLELPKVELHKSTEREGKHSGTDHGDDD